MSWKIHNGFRFRQKCLARVHEDLMAFRPLVHAMQKEMMTKWLAREATLVIDKRALGETTGDDSDSPLSRCIQDMWRRQKEIKATGRRDTSVDWSFSLAVLPFEGNVYGLSFIEKPELRALLRQQEWFEDFSWWDNSDCPDAVSHEEWEARGRVWQNLLRQDRVGRPSECGFGVDIDQPNPCPKVAEVAALVPTLDERARQHAKERVISLYTERKRAEFTGTDEEWKEEFFRIVLRGVQFAQSEEGAAAIAQLRDEVARQLPQAITLEMLISAN